MGKILETLDDLDSYWENKKRYEDRISICQEIAEVLAVRGYFVPKDFCGPDLINAVAMALDKKSTTT